MRAAALRPEAVLDAEEVARPPTRRCGRAYGPPRELAHVAATVRLATTTPRGTRTDISWAGPRLSGVATVSEPGIRQSSPGRSTALHGSLSGERQAIPIASRGRLKPLKQLAEFRGNRVSQ